MKRVLSTFLLLLLLLFTCPVWAATIAVNGKVVCNGKICAYNDPEDQNYAIVKKRSRTDKFYIYYPTTKDTYFPKTLELKDSVRSLQRGGL